MNSAELQTQLARAGFPEGVTVTTYREEKGHIEGHDDLSGTVFQVTGADEQGENGGFELLLTDKAAKMYGEGPALMLTIDQLKKHIAAGLPARQGDEYQRLTFVGD